MDVHGTKASLGIGVSAHIAERDAAIPGGGPDALGKASRFDRAEGSIKTGFALDFPDADLTIGIFDLHCAAYLLQSNFSKRCFHIHFVPGCAAADPSIRRSTSHVASNVGEADGSKTRVELLVTVHRIDVHRAVIVIYRQLSMNIPGGHRAEGVVDFRRSCIGQFHRAISARDSDHAGHIAYDDGSE